ncbi:MAG: glycosyltransferase, partial [Mangrovicoccus sp.]
YSISGFWISHPVLWGHMVRIYYDLTELFFATGSRFKYYGISRTVMEIGYELAIGAQEVGFVIFSPAHGRFFEVTPRLGPASPSGVLDPGLPAQATPVRLRHSFPRPNRARDFFYPLAQRVVRAINLRRWQDVAPEDLREVDLSGHILISLGRPKIMADCLGILGQDAEKIHFFPLLHDMIPLYEFAHPSQSMFSSNFAHDNHRVIRHAKGLLSNSLFTKGEIERFGASKHLPPLPPVTAVPLSHELRATSEPVAIKPPTDPYLLCVGIMRGRKNLECVMQALLHLQRTGRPVPHLVLAGARRKRTEVYIERPEFTQLRSKIHLVANPNQSELRVLYQNAMALVIASHMEGWGLPLGEALWVGTPALASTAPALREAGGEEGA